MPGFVIVIQWFHVLLGIFWFGSVLYTDFVLLPTIAKLPMVEQQKVGGLLGPASSRVLVPVGLTVVTLGFLRGTVFGRLHSLDAVFGSVYGRTWLTALTLGLIVVFWGLRVLAPRGEALATATSAEEYGARIKQLRPLMLTEIAIFVAIFTCMILMRFDL
jgi:uncharacterized membrane protein